MVTDFVSVTSPLLLLLLHLEVVMALLRAGLLRLLSYDTFVRLESLLDRLVLQLLLRPSTAALTRTSMGFCLSATLSPRTSPRHLGGAQNPSMLLRAASALNVNCAH